MSGFTIWTSRPSLRTPELTANLATLMAGVVPFFQLRMGIQKYLGYFGTPEEASKAYAAAHAAVYAEFSPGDAT